MAGGRGGRGEFSSANKITFTYPTRQSGSSRFKSSYDDIRQISELLLHIKFWPIGQSLEIAFSYKIRITCLNFKTVLRPYIVHTIEFDKIPIFFAQVDNINLFSLPGATPPHSSSGSEGWISYLVMYKDRFCRYDY